MSEFTTEEKELLKKILLSTPIQGTVQSLPSTLEIIVSILKKIDEPSPPKTDPDYNNPE